MIFIVEEFNATPLSSSFMITSILGFLISIFYIRTLSPSFAAAFALVFFLMFMASFISMTKAPVGDETFINDLSIHEKHKHLRRHRMNK